MDQKHKCSLPGCLSLHKASVKVSSGAIAYPKSRHVGPTSEAAFLVPGRKTYLRAVGVRAPVLHCSWPPPSAPWQRPPPSSQQGRLPSEGERDRSRSLFITLSWKWVIRFSPHSAGRVTQESESQEAGVFGGHLRGCWSQCTWIFKLLSMTLS